MGERKPLIPTGIPKQGGPPPTSRPQATAQGIVASLVLPPARPAPAPPASPLPPTGLHQLPRDASMLYDIGRVDGSGRLTSNGIINTLRWHPGSNLDVIVTSWAIVIRAAPNGLFSVPRRPCIIVPAHARRRHSIKARGPGPDRRSTGLRPRARVPAISPGRDDLPLPLGPA